MEAATNKERPKEQGSLSFAEGAKKTCQVCVGLALPLF